ncbi:putative gpi-anchored cell surface glyco protein [Neofusicoccum parvum UCRNP2]|uniref:Putative gpi-anchored cell surface glyco protein n=1 Tax=Botryosphaeria parva (strain UCR-NP2) TaxID=1287680 RepID=R1EBM9_BOTPV|nr:putative gpi-anchored cell surface glyco protein [Neofusicoccum parvum UCRNP2]
MSLNGLDDAPVTEAYQSALAEAGGWFLLKYASRDAVEIFNFGSGGLSEARAAVLEYDEKSPLYGFLLFRRRKVLLKYVPEGTSRLLQGTAGGDTNASVIASPKGYAQSVRSFKSLNHHDYLHYDDPNRRSSSQTARADLDFSYLYKPKVKLGPRPTQEPLPNTNESKKSAKLPSSLKAAVRSKGSSSRPKSRDSTAAMGPELSEDITTALPSSSSLPERRSTTKSKRRVPVDPIRVDPDAESSDDDCDYLSDDSLMEELQSATVEEAMPMSVSKSPIMPIFPRRKSQASTLSTKSAEHRVNSNPLAIYRTDNQARLSPSPESHAGVGQRSLSASYASEAQSKAPLVKKSNVSSGISQRIKALAEKSAKDAAAAPIPKVGYTPDPKTFSSVAHRSNSFRVSHSESRPDSKHLKRLSKSSFISVPPLERPTSRGENSGESIQAVYNKDANNKTESVTVTARIIRAPQTPCQELEDSPLDLQQSPITIDRNKADDAPAPPSIVIPAAAEEQTMSPKSGDVSPSTQPSNANLESPAQALPRSSSESSWRSFGRRRSEAMSPPPMPRSQSVTSFDSTATEEGEEKKKGNRASRLLKRMSNSLSSSKKSLNQMMSSPVQEEPSEPIQPIQEKKESQPGIEIGDLNVQFPDTLLWKRRWVEIDVQGNIVLSLSKSNEQSKGITKRYHLSEFQAPFAPDQEREEMPNSVMLDFHDGRTLQCACESASGQVSVLRLLKDAHKSWTQ